MRNWKGLLAVLSLVALAGAANAQQPTIGVYFDRAGTQTTMVAPFTSNDPGFVTAYIIAAHTEQTVAGAAFKLVLPAGVSVEMATYPMGIQVGELTDGIQIGLTNCQYGFYDNPVLLATLLLSTNTFMTEAPIDIVAYPREGVIQLADCQAALTTVEGGHASLTVYPPTVLGVFWDKAGAETNMIATYGGSDVFFTAYILAIDTEQTVAGVSFQLQMDSHIHLEDATYPAGIQVGTPEDGMQVAFTNCAFGYYGAPVLISTMTLSCDAVIAEGQLSILPYPPAGEIQLADCRAYLRPIAGGTATLTVPVPAESQTWGQVKDLYGR